MSQRERPNEELVRAETSWLEQALARAPAGGDPIDSMRLAMDYIGFVFNLYSAGMTGTLSPELFDGGLKLSTRNAVIHVRGDYSAEALKAWSWNLLLSGIAVTTQAVNRALEDLYGPKPLERNRDARPEDLNDFEAAWSILYMIRNAFAHDPFNPRWQCRGQYVGTFRVRALGITVTAATLNDSRVSPEDYGGHAGFLELIRFCREAARTGGTAR